jgi:hypothetical protein
MENWVGTNTKAATMCLLFLDIAVYSNSIVISDTSTCLFMTGEPQDEGVGGEVVVRLSGCNTESLTVMIDYCLKPNQQYSGR